MSLDRKTLEAVLGLQPVATIYGDCIEVKKIQALLKGLTEAGEAGRVMVAPGGTGMLHWENDHISGIKCSDGARSTRCTPAPDTEETRAWVARQRKDSHAG